MTRELANLGHALGGPTRLMLRPGRMVVIRMAFTPEEWEQDEHDSDEEIGWLRLDGSLIPACHHNYRALAWGAKRDGERLWRYVGERFDESPVWRLRDGVVP